MKIYILTFISVLFISCGNTSEKSTIPNGFESKPVNFLNKNVIVPLDYEKVNLNELGEMIKHNPNINPVNQLYYKMAISVYNDTKIVPVLYTQQTDIENNIWFMPAPYMVLDKELLNQYVLMLDDLLENRGTLSNSQFERLENKFISRNNLKAFKIKYQQTRFEKRKFITQYIVTKNLETFSMVVLNNENIDFPETFKSL